jgi:hypothetical protein
VSGPLRISLTLVAIIIASCSSGSDDDAAPVATSSTLPPDPDSVLEASARFMGEVDTVRFSIERSGAPIHIDPADLLTFNTAEGRFAAPTSADALVTIRVGGINTEIGAIAFEGKTWLSNPITGEYSLAPGGYAFDPATLFDPAIGWRPLLTSGLTGVEWLGTVPGPDGQRYRMTATADPERLEVITAGLVRNQTVVLDMRFDTSTGAVREVSFDTVNEGETSSWALTFSDYGEDLEVSPPPDGG